MLDPMTLRQVCGQFATGVTVVTTRCAEEIHGMTVNSFASLSLDPMLVLFCADKKTNTHGYVDQSGVFAINILRADQRPISDRFASKDLPEEQRFEGLSFCTALTGAPIFDCTAGYLDCRVSDRLPGGDHTIFVGKVEAMECFGGDPLVFHAGKYTHLKEEL